MKNKKKQKKKQNEKGKVDEKKNKAITKGIHPVGLPFTLSGYHSPSRATIHPVGLQFTPSGYDSPRQATVHPLLDYFSAKGLHKGREAPRVRDKGDTNVYNVCSHCKTPKSLRTR
jgi:hypothetical protein